MPSKKRSERSRSPRVVPSAAPAADPRKVLERMPPAVRAPLELLIAVLAAIALLLLALKRVSLGSYPTYLGKYYAMLATDPFHPTADNPVGHRILAPLVSWMIGWRGPYLLYTNLGFVLLLLAAVFLWMRRRGHGVLQAMLGTSVVAFSMTALTTLHYGGYPDALCYLLVFAAWCARRWWWLACSLFLLAMLAHESTVFLSPWLAVELARPDGERRRGWLRAGGAIAATVLAFFALRIGMEHAHPSVGYTTAFYLAPLMKDPLFWFRESAPHRWLGVAAAFNLCWLFALAAAAHLAVEGKRADAVRLLLPIVCALAQLFVAYDVTRLATLAFPSVLLGIEHLLRTDAWRARTWAPALVLGNFFVPQVNIAMGVIDRMGPPR